MHPSALAVIALLLISACSSGDPAPARAAPTATDKLSVPVVPQTSNWVLDLENHSVQFSCKHVFTNVRGMFHKPSVNRKDFGLRWEFPGEGAGVVVGDNIEISIDAELVLQPEPSKGG